MKMIVIFAFAMSTLCLCGVSLPRAAAQSTGASGQQAVQSPIYCNRKALNPEQTARKEELGHLLRTSNRRAREVDHGYEFEFSSDPKMVQAAAEWASLEKLCCPFFDIDLRLECENGPFFLRLTGREGVKEFIHSDFAPWFQHTL